MSALDALSAWPPPAAAAVVAGRPPAVVAAVGDLDHPFAWASVTKLCTALAALVALEEGTIALEQPAGPPGATVAHLLAHASGLAPDDDTVLTAPGRRRIYSNRGFEIVAEVVAAGAAMPFTSYLRQAVLEPLAMDGTALAPGASPAWGLVGPVADLAALGRQLLAPTIVDRATLQRATTVVFPGLAGVLPGFGRQDPCDWGLGFELRDAKHPHWTGANNSPATFGHFGQAGGFLWVDPAHGVACAVLGERPFGPWAAAAWPVLSDAVLAEAPGSR